MKRRLFAIRLNRLEFSKKQAAAALSAAALCLFALESGSETYKMITYYPAPYGSYAKFKTTGLTMLATGGDAVYVGAKLASAPVPQYPPKLFVGGNIQSTGTIAAGNIARTTPGLLRFNDDKLEYSVDGGATWQPSAGSTNVPTFVNIEVSGNTNPQTRVVSQKFSSSASVYACTGASKLQCTESWTETGNGMRAQNNSRQTTFDNSGCTASVSGNTVTVNYTVPSCASHTNTNPCGGQQCFNVAVHYFSGGTFLSGSAVVEVLEKNVATIK